MLISSLDIKSREKWGRAAGTNLVYKVHTPGCKHFLLRFWQKHLWSIFSQTWNTFCLPGQDCFGRFFFLQHFYIQSFSSGTEETRRQRPAKDPGKKVKGFLSDIGEEGGMSFFLWPLKQHLSYCCLVRGGRISRRVWKRCQYSLNQDNLPQHAKRRWKALVKPGH